MASNLAFTSQGATTAQPQGKVTGVLAPNNQYGIGTSAQNLVQAPIKAPTLGNNTGLIKPSAPAPSSALKKSTTTNTDGSTVTHEYHAPLPPDDPSNAYNTATGEKNKNYVDPKAPKPETPAPSTTESRTSAVQAAGNFTPTEQGLVGGSAVNNANKALTEFRQAEAKKYGDIESSGIPLNFQQGREQVLGRQFASQEATLQTGVSNALSNQSQQIGLAENQAGRTANAAGTVFNAGLNQQGSYGAPAFNPLTGDYTSNGQFGGVDASSNIQTIKDLTTKINDIDSQSDAVNNNFSRAIDYATNAGLTGNVPILAGFQNRFGANFITNPAVIGFNQALGALNAQLQSLGQSPIDPQSATADTIKQAQETVKKNLLTAKSNFQSEKDAKMNGGTSSGSTGSTGGSMFGSFF